MYSLGIRLCLFMILNLFFYKISDMISSILDIGKNLSDIAGAVNQTQPLPPSSTQKFLQKHLVPALVLTDHKEKFTNRLIRMTFYYLHKAVIRQHVKKEY